MSYDAEMKEDLGDPDDRAVDEFWDKVDELENARPSTDRPIEKMVVDGNSQLQGKVQQPTASEGVCGGVRKITGKRKGRGPMKGFKATEPMFLEYDSLGQPCGRWQQKYGTHIGLCVRKLSILWAWNKVLEGLLKTLWDDTMRVVFLSGLAERFRNFKSKLVSG